MFAFMNVYPRCKLSSCVQVYDNDEDVDREATLRLPRDTKNPTAFDKERQLGSYRTTQSMAFTPPPEVLQALAVACV